MSYEVQQYTLCDGWVNTWTIWDQDDQAETETFSSRSEAQAALDEFFGEIRDEILAGQRPAENGYDRYEFRIVKAGAS